MSNDPKYSGYVETEVERQPCEWHGRNMGNHSWVSITGGWKRCVKCKREYFPNPHSPVIDTTPEEAQRNDGHRHGDDKAICYCDNPNNPGVVGFVAVDPSPLPVDEKFTLWLDEEGDYLIQAQRQDESQYLTAHGGTPDDAVWNMRKILDLAKEVTK